MRGSSSTENFHRHQPHALGGANTSPELAKAALLLHVHRWNTNIGIKNAGLTDYGSTNLLKLLSITELATKLRRDKVFPDLAERPAVDGAGKPRCQLIDLGRQAADAKSTSECLDNMQAARAGVPFWRAHARLVRMQKAS